MDPYMLGLQLGLQKNAQARYGRMLAALGRTANPEKLRSIENRLLMRAFRKPTVEKTLRSLGTFAHKIPFRPNRGLAPDSFTMLLDPNVAAAMKPLFAKELAAGIRTSYV